MILEVGLALRYKSWHHSRHQSHQCLERLGSILVLAFAIHAAARLAQSVEHETLNLRVVGSSPTLGAFLFFRGLDISIIDLTVGV